VVADSAARWRPSAAERGITLTHRHEGTPATVWAARADLERALDALVENALRYSPRGSTVSIVDTPGRLEVRDRGPGVPAEEREMVLERFQRGRSGRAGEPGHGLGLAIARELVRGWGGEITIEGRDGGGTIAIIALASQPDDADAAPALPGLNPPAASVPNR
jgi:signal transduction histidine kinase